jgi:hypothetical protein
LCFSISSGNPHSTMGKGDLESVQADFMAPLKLVFDWMDETSVQEVEPYTADGVGLCDPECGPFTLARTDSGVKPTTTTTTSTDTNSSSSDNSEPSAVITIQIATSTRDRYYFIEHRMSTTAGESAALVSWADIRGGGGTGIAGNTVLADCTPETASWHDAGCTPGSHLILDVGTQTRSRPLLVTVGALGLDGSLSVTLSTSKKLIGRTNELLTVTVGDTLVLHRDTSQDLALGRAFNWSAIAEKGLNNNGGGLLDGGAVSLTLENTNGSIGALGVSLEVTPVNTLLVDGNSTLHHVVTLSATLTENVEPSSFATLRLMVEPYGYGVVVGGGTVKVLPVVTQLSHRSGSNAGGLEVTLTGRGIGYSSAVVTVGGRLCVNVVPNTTNALTCTTTSFAYFPTTEDDGDHDQGGAAAVMAATAVLPANLGAGAGWGRVVVRVGDADSLCLDPDVTETVFDAEVDETTGRLGNRTNIVHKGCEFFFGRNTSHTPVFESIDPKEGHWIPSTSSSSSSSSHEVASATIIGQGFASSGNAVLMGSVAAKVLSENETHIVVAIPKHVGGTYPLQVKVPNEGFAAGHNMWFRFQSGIVEVSPKKGSIFGGQRLTITGFGFAPLLASSTNGNDDASVANDDDDGDGDGSYLQTFGGAGGWRNVGDANFTASVGLFELDVHRASYNTLVATTHFRDQRVVGGAPCQEDDGGWLRGLTVSIVREGLGAVPGLSSSYDFVYASADPDGADTETGAEKAFDGDLSTVFNSKPELAGGTQVWYGATAPFLLTDYQLVWNTEDSESPSRWSLYASEGPDSPNVLIDEFKGPRSEPANYKYLNATVDRPGYYKRYIFVFTEWAPRNGNLASNNDGHQIREIILNPAGSAVISYFAHFISIKYDWVPLITESLFFASLFMTILTVRTTASLLMNYHMFDLPPFQPCFLFGSKQTHFGLSMTLTAQSNSSSSSSSSQHQSPTVGVPVGYINLAYDQPASQSSTKVAIKKTRIVGGGGGTT